MKPQVNVALIGISGYGHAYLSALLDSPADDAFGLVAVADPTPQRSRRLSDLENLSLPIYPDLESLLAQHQVDLTILATPIHCHSPQTCLALERGSSVLCEKPVGATVDDARRMLQAQRRSRGFVAIGYQWSYSRAVQALKRDIMSGDLGRPIRLKTLATMPRSVEYFRRNDWVGRVRTADGRLVYDSPANNAAAHYLHNMLYLLGPHRDASGNPTTVQAELYRANEIENYDTAAIRCGTDAGAELLFYTSHATPIGMGPVLHYEFEYATVYYEAETRGGFVARFRDGSLRHYGDPNVDRHLKIWHSIDAVRSPKPLPCGIRAASSHALTVEAAQRSMPQVSDLPAELITLSHIDGQQMKSVFGLGSALVQCYDQAILPSEHGALSWAVSGKVIDLSSAPSFDNDAESGEVFSQADPVALGK